MQQSELILEKIIELKKSQFSKKTQIPKHSLFCSKGTKLSYKIENRELTVFY